MTTTDIYAHSITGSIERIIACMDGLKAEQMNWKPTAQDTNSLYVLAVHTMANAEQTVLRVLGGEDIPRERDEEFLATGESADWIQERWSALKPKLEASLAILPQEALDKQYEHPRRGAISGYQALLITATHAAEHVGHAEVTRDLLKAQV
jgi:hypothetical protein